MAPFDYTTPERVFAYGSSAGTATDPVDESAIMADLVSGMSRAIDTYCNQAFSLDTYAQQSVRGVVDQYGVLTAYAGVPSISAITAADYGGGNVYTPLNVSELAIEAHGFGTVVRTFGSGYGSLRNARVGVRLSYSGGWANLSEVPPDFEWAMRSLCWWAYQKRSAPSDRMAIPDLGVLIIPGSWPPHIKKLFAPYVRWIPM